MTRRPSSPHAVFSEMLRGARELLAIRSPLDAKRQEFVNVRHAPTLLAARVPVVADTKGGVPVERVVVHAPLSDEASFAIQHTLIRSEHTVEPLGVAAASR